MPLQAQDTVLFQGDSITDAGRDRALGSGCGGINSPAGLGQGYAMLAAARCLADRPGDRLQFLNRGISGNRVVDLYARWKVDALNLRPTVISILIGVNDTWHHFTSDNGVEPERYEQVYRMLLQWTRQVLPAVRLILCEPFVLNCGAVTEPWLHEMEKRQRIVRELSDAFDATFVPFQQTFDLAAEQAPPEYWAADGVHPTAAGHHRMAQTWLEAVGEG